MYHSTVWQSEENLLGVASFLPHMGSKNLPTELSHQPVSAILMSLLKDKYLILLERRFKRLLTYLSGHSVYELKQCDSHIRNNFPPIPKVFTVCPFPQGAYLYAISEKQRRIGDFSLVYQRGS